MTMTQEEKQLLMVDLCGRLPYGVKGKTLGSKTCTLKYIGVGGDFTADTYHGWLGSKQFIPYLRPMPSMTEEERKEYTSYVFDQPFLQKDKDINLGSVLMCIDWLNAHHFDYRGLIDKRLALEAPEGTYKF